MQQVISINPDGSLEGIDREGMVDIKQLGTAKVHRCSEIIWGDGNWYVHTLEHGILTNNDGVLLFDSYKEAVDCEIKFFNDLIGR